MSEDLSFRRKPLTPEQRQARDAARRIEAEKAMRDHEEAQKQFYVPRVCRAEAFFCIGMSEPNSGSDLASVATRAVRCEGGWRRDGAGRLRSFAAGGGECARQRDHLQPS